MKKEWFMATLTTIILLFAERSATDKGNVTTAERPAHAPTAHVVVETLV
jgi:hypothetical protein